MFWATCPFCQERLMSTCSWCQARQAERNRLPEPIDYTTVEPETQLVNMFPRLTYQPQENRHLRLVAVNGRLL